MRKRGDKKGAKNGGNPEAAKESGTMPGGYNWEITDEDLKAPLPDGALESAGLERGEESLRAMTEFLRRRYGDDPPEDPGSSGGGSPRPTPNLPNYPIGGGGAT